MENKDWERAKALFVDFLDLPEGEREAFIAEHVGDNENIKSMLITLIDGQDISERDNAVSQVVGNEAQEILSNQDRVPNKNTIDAYDIENIIGKGGMGTVYKAKRSDQEFEQTLAIKIIQQEVFAQRSIERFKQERQILASLQHPNIAQLIDGGETNTGLPYIAMEYVDGLDIVTYCKQHRLPIRARLELFKQVMSAISYAHQNLIIHRDIKPSNVLVDIKGVVKLLDFGIAKFIEDKALPADQNLTAFEVKVLTPANASPEQVKQQKVTTRTDVYGLCTLLYQMLTEQALYDTSSATSHEIESWIINKSPTKPSESISTNHSAKNINVKSTLSGDLDTIILKGLQKEPDRRYNSVEQLKQDVQCYLSNYPIYAKPDSKLYKLKKFYHRNRAFTVVSGALVLSLLSFSAVVSYQAVEINKARVTAITEANNARQISHFLRDTFEAANPYFSGEKQVSPLDLVDRASSKINDINTNDLLKLKLMITVIEVYKAIGNNQKALALLEQAKGLIASFTQKPEQELLTIEVLEASLILNAKDADSANQLNLAVLDKVKQKYAGLGQIIAEPSSNAEYIELLLSALLTQGSIYDRKGDYKNALSISEEALEIANRHKIVSSKSLTSIYTLLGHSHRKLLNYEESVNWLFKSLEFIKAQHGEFNLELAYAYNQLASTYNYLEKWDEAIELAQKSLQIHEALFPDGSPETAASLGNLSNIYRAMGDTDNAYEYRIQSVAETKRAFGENHVYVGATLLALATFLIDTEQYSEAKTHALRALPIMQSNLSRDSVDLSRPFRILGRIEYHRGDYTKALAHLQEAIDISTNAVPDGHWLSGEIHAYLSLSYFAIGDKAKALSHKNSAIELFGRIFGENSKRNINMKKLLTEVEI